MDQYIKEKVRITLEKLIQIAEPTIIKCDNLKYKETDYKKGGEIPTVDDSWKTFGEMDRIQGRDKHFWFYTEIDAPNVADDEELVLQIRTGEEGKWEWDAGNPQGLLYINEEIVQGIDVNHRKAYLKPGKKSRILLYFYCGMGGVIDPIEMHLEVKLRNKQMVKLYYDMKVPYDTALCFEEDDYNHVKTINYLERTCNLIDFRDTNSDEFKKSIKVADDFIINEYYGKECGKTDAVVSYIGHTHIDVAWLWTLAQTREKVQRSFSTVLMLMDRYPEYVFMSSQPQLYEYLKEEEPELYEKVKARVKEGRWEVEGAMWLEADCNLSSGESLVRQIVYGKRFMKEEFDVDSKILWLPDVFGYSAALPQILQKSGVNKFVTSKISWNETNMVPYNTFMWEGIDGTEIFTYFLTAQTHEEYKKNWHYATYTAKIRPEMHLGTWENFKQKEYNNEVIATYGYGDGGGGSTEEMIETERRLEYGLPGMPKAQMSKASDFLDRVEKNFTNACEENGRIPKWVGELYLEMHRGTYTSIAKIKKNNRECEFLCQGTETVSVIDKILKNGAYPHSELHSAWKKLLLNQFHDIIPGSSIFEVYEDSDKDYAFVRDSIGTIKKNKMQSIADNLSKKGIMVYNPNGFIASGYVKTDDGYKYVENISPIGWTVLDEFVKTDDVTVGDKTIESKYYSIVFDENMNIKSLYDKENDREVVAENGRLNQLFAFEDEPRMYDNWEITSYYKQKKYDINDVSNVTKIVGDGFGGFEIERKYFNSTIKQRVIVYGNSRRIDVENTIDWHEHHTLLKAMFPVDIHTNKANYDIQFGYAERPNNENTSWEAAKFEVCAHKWADLSETDYGVSILNNCKYGYSALGNEMTLTLIKCGTYPNPEADQGLHEFTYSIYPHKDDFKKGGTVNESYLLNRPFELAMSEGSGELPSCYSLIECDAENVVVETVKEAENGNGIVVRMYENWNKKTNATLKLGFDAKKISISDMLENPIEEIGRGNTVNVKLKNFEILTLLIEK